MSWGKKTLAYDIKKFDKGVYVRMQYCGESDLTAEIKREMSLDDRILKYQTIKLSDNADLEKLMPKPTPSETESVETVEVETVEVEVAENAENSEATVAEGEGEKDGL